MENLIHFSDTMLSDMFKDANNFRPRHYKEYWTESELEEEYNYQYPVSSICRLQA